MTTIKTIMAKNVANTTPLAVASFPLRYKKRTAIRLVVAAITYKAIGLCTNKDVGMVLKVVAK